MGISLDFYKYFQNKTNKTKMSLFKATGPFAADSTHHSDYLRTRHLCYVSDRIWIQTHIIFKSTTVNTLSQQISPFNSAILPIVNTLNRTCRLLCRRRYEHYDCAKSSSNSTPCRRHSKTITSGLQCHRQDLNSHLISKFATPGLLVDAQAYHVIDYAIIK